MKYPLAPWPSGLPVLYAHDREREYTMMSAFYEIIIIYCELSRYMPYWIKSDIVQNPFRQVGRHADSQTNSWSIILKTWQNKPNYKCILSHEMTTMPLLNLILFLADSVIKLYIDSRPTRFWLLHSYSIRTFKVLLWEHLVGKFITFNQYALTFDSYSFDHVQIIITTYY